MENTQPEESEKATSSQPTPPAPEEHTKPSVEEAPPEESLHSSPSSFRLLRKLRFRPRWGSKKDVEEIIVVRRESGEVREEVVEEEEDEDNVVVISERSDSPRRRRRHSASSSGYSYYYSSLSSRSSREREDVTGWKLWWKKARGFLPSWNGFIPLIGYHHVLIIISSVAIVLMSLLIAGCSSNRMRNIYLLSLSYRAESPNATTDSITAAANPSFYSLVANVSLTGDLIVRVGYFGICIATGSKSGAQKWTCRPKATDLADKITPHQDPLNLLTIGDNYRDQVILIMATILIFLGMYGLSTFPGWQESEEEDGEVMDVKPFPSQIVSHLVLGFNLLASLFLLVGVLWQHVATLAHAATTQAAFGGAVQGEIGSVAIGLGWGAIGASFLVTLGICIMIASIRLLNKLTGDDDDDDD